MPKASRKDPHKPKGAKSAYIFFVESERADQESRGEQLAFSEFSRQCGVRWAQLTAAEKMPFIKMSGHDRTRYEGEMSTYIPPPHFPGDSDSDNEERGMGGGSKKRKKKKDPNAPKRPLSAYFVYAGHVRPGIRAENPSLPITQVATMIGQKWRDLDAEGRKQFEEEAGKDKQRYETQMQQYNQYGTF